MIEVSRRLGHSRASIILDVYAQLILGMQSEVADLLDDLVTPVAVLIGFFILLLKINVHINILHRFQTNMAYHHGSDKAMTDEVRGE